VTLYGLAATKCIFRSKFEVVSLPPAAWKSLSIDLSGVPSATAFVMEMRLEREPENFRTASSQRVGEGVANQE